MVAIAGALLFSPTAQRYGLQFSQSILDLAHISGLPEFDEFGVIPATDGPPMSMPGPNNDGRGGGAP